MWMTVHGGTIAFDDFNGKNSVTIKIRKLLDQIQLVFRKHSMTLDEKKTELAIIYKGNKNRKKWETEANRWSMK
jgi:hypothetical protein